MNAASADRAHARAPLRLATRRLGTQPPCLLLIHGLGDGAFVWNRFIACFSRQIGAITVDLRGHGESPWDATERYERAALATDVLAAFDEMRTRGITLIGHSLGAEIAIEVAASRPEAVSLLVIVDGGPEIEDRGAQAMQQHMQAQSWRYESVAEFETVLANRHPLADSESIKSYARNALREAPDGGFELKVDPAVMHSLQPHDPAQVWASLRAVQCPVLLVRGAMSAMLSQRQAVNVSRALPNCELATVPLAGHAVVLENPQGLHAAVWPFLTRARGATQG